MRLMRFASELRIKAQVSNLGTRASSSRPNATLAQGEDDLFPQADPFSAAAASNLA
jgi:hypothetical protein